MATHLRIIGDIHGERDCYRKLIENIPYTIQIGDFEYEFDWLLREGISQERHRFIGGNHDNYDNAPHSPHYMGDFGVYTVPEFGDIFFVRGAWSIDHRARRAHTVYDRGRVLHANYWPDKEELSINEAMEALKLYKKVRPNFVIAHECPLSILGHVTNPDFAYSFGYKEPLIRTKTNQLLQAMIDFHRPKTFVFGHYHKNFDTVIDGTRFICANICQGVDFPVDYQRTEYVPVNHLEEGMKKEPEKL